MRGQLRISGGRKLLSPNGLGTRPTTSIVREATMSLLGSELIGSNWLDLFSGSGAMGCEALLRGATKVIAIEQNNKIARICKSNLISVNESLSNKALIEVFQYDVVNWLKKGFQKRYSTENTVQKYWRFNFVYIDPPYHSNLYSSVLINLLKGDWINAKSLVICEHSTDLPLTLPKNWKEEDRRVYGKSSLLIISPQ